MSGWNQKAAGRPFSRLFALVVIAFSCVWTFAEESPIFSEPEITESDRDHWSFRELKRPAVPEVSARDWTINPVDYFVLNRIEAKQLQPQAQAGKSTLLRRLYFDFIGLPPSPEQVQEFLNDTSPAAYDRLVDRLLASPHYGERWAQHWLDVARFAETDGFEHDRIRQDAWKYRDWVIQSLNQDLPYADFVRLQIAGDELKPGDQAARIATAFCLSGPDMPDINSQEERRHQLLNDITSTVGSVIIGLQFGCAQCHDHKYDPLSLGDFYRLRAIFEPSVQLKKNESISVLAEKPGKPSLSYVMLRGDWQRRGPPIEPGFPRIVNRAETRIADASASGKSSGRRSALAEWFVRADHPLTSRVIANRVWQYHFGKGLSRTPSDFGIVGDEPTHPELLDWLAVELVESGWSLKHLHRVIVMSATYRQSSRPIDPEWPAEVAERSDANWQAAVANDPTNYYLTRFSRQRISGETIRDAMLDAAGVLNNAQGGPGVQPPLPAEVVRVLLKDQWSVSKNQSDHFRRSVYVFARRNLRYPIFEAFDRPDANASCPRRSQSTTAPQSLLLLNSELSLDLARRMAGRVLREAPESTESQIRAAIRIVFGREARSEELETMGQFHREQASLIRSEGRSPESLAVPNPMPPAADPYDAAALTDLCLALFNASEFLYID